MKRWSLLVFAGLGACNEPAASGVLEVEPPGCPVSTDDPNRVPWVAEAIADLGTRQIVGALDGRDVGVTVTLSTKESAVALLTSYLADSGECRNRAELPVSLALDTDDGSLSVELETTSSITTFSDGGLDVYVRPDTASAVVRGGREGSFTLEETVTPVDVDVAWGVRDGDLWGAVTGPLDGTPGAPPGSQPAPALVFGSPID